MAAGHGARTYPALERFPMTRGTPPQPLDECVQSRENHKLHRIAHDDESACAAAIPARRAARIHARLLPGRAHLRCGQRLRSVASTRCRDEHFAGMPALSRNPAPLRAAPTVAASLRQGIRIVSRSRACLAQGQKKKGNPEGYLFRSGLRLAAQEPGRYFSGTVVLCCRTSRP